MTSNDDRRAAIRNRIMAKHEVEIAAWRKTQAYLPEPSDAEFDEAQQDNWLDSARTYDPEANLGE